MKYFKNLSIKSKARIAGLLYLMQIPLGVFGILYVPKALHVANNGAATVSNIILHENLFRLSIISAVITALLTVLTSLTLYKVLKVVHKNAAGMMVLFTIMVAPITIINELNHGAVLILLSQGAHSNLQIQELVMALL